MISFLLSLSTWDWLSAGGVFFVLLGVVFGFVVKRGKFPHLENPDELMPLEFKKKQWESKKEKWENFWEYVLIVGLGLELAVLPHSVKEFEVLRKSNLELQSKLQPRTITLTQIKNFIFLTEKVTKTVPIKIVVGHEGFDTETYAFQLRDMLNRAGFKTNDDAGLWGINREPDIVFATPVSAKPDMAEINLFSRRF
jgi:hypothetical protein